MEINKLHEGKLCEVTILARVKTVGVNHVSLQGDDGEPFIIHMGNIDAVVIRDSVDDYDATKIYEDASGLFWMLDTNSCTGEPNGRWMTFGDSDPYTFDYPKRPLKPIN